MLKPAVYLTALEQPQRYTLATLLDDSPLTYTARNGDVWAPGNYDRQNHGEVPLYLALAQSYNISTARLGLTSVSTRSSTRSDDWVSSRN